MIKRALDITGQNPLETLRAPGVPKIGDIWDGHVCTSVAVQAEINQWRVYAYYDEDPKNKQGLDYTCEICGAHTIDPKVESLFDGAEQGVMKFKPGRILCPQCYGHLLQSYESTLESEGNKMKLQIAVLDNQHLQLALANYEVADIVLPDERPCIVEVELERLPARPRLRLFDVKQNPWETR